MLLSTGTTYNFWGQKCWFLYCAVLLCTLSFEVRYKPAPPSQWDSEGVTAAPHVKARSLGPAVNPLLFPFGNYGCYICQSPDRKMWTTLNMHSRRFFFFLGPYLWHKEVPRLGVKSKLQVPDYATATAILDPGCICNLCCSLWQCQILNPLSEARDQTCVLPDTM